MQRSKHVYFKIIAQGLLHENNFF